MSSFTELAGLDEVSEEGLFSHREERKSARQNRRESIKASHKEFAKCKETITEIAKDVLAKSNSPYKQFFRVGPAVCGSDSPDYLELNAPYFESVLSYSSKGSKVPVYNIEKGYSEHDKFWKYVDSLTDQIAKALNKKYGGTWKGMPDDDSDCWRGGVTVSLPLKDMLEIFAPKTVAEENLATKALYAHGKWWVKNFQRVIGAPRKIKNGIKDFRKMGKRVEKDKKPPQEQNQELVSKLTNSEHVAAMRKLCSDISKRPKYKLIVSDVSVQKGGWSLQNNYTACLFVGDFEERFNTIEKSCGGIGPEYDKQCDAIYARWDDLADECMGACEKYLKSNNLPGMIDEMGADGCYYDIAWCDVPENFVKNLKGSTPAEEGFFANLIKAHDAKKYNAPQLGPAKKAVEIPDEIQEKYRESFEKDGRKHVKAMQDIFKKIVRDPVHRLASKGFKITNYDEDYDEGMLFYSSYNGGMFYVDIVSWDLWDIYSDARTRFGDGNIEEFNALYDALVTAFSDYLSSKHLPGSMDEGGDWDGGGIEWAIPASQMPKLVRIEL